MEGTEVQDDFEGFFQSLTDLLTFCDEKCAQPSQSDIEYCCDRLSLSVQALEYIEFHLSECNSFDLVPTIQDLLHLFRIVKQNWNENAIENFTPSQLAILEDAVHPCANGPGRPAFVIDIEKFQYLFSLGFKKSDIAKCFLINRTTLWRKLKETGIDVARYSSLSDDSLTIEIRNVYQNHPHCGVSMMLGHLRSRGIVVQHRRVRQILRDIDPANSIMRWGLMARRRAYCVPCVNSLWHIDGHHALIRWKMVTHGGIDGFSRLIVYLQCSRNNLAETVFNLFLDATNKCGIPSRVRGDKGCENGLVAEYMEEIRGTERGSFISGKSVHNSRIERLWRDVFYAVIQTYYHIFYYLESVDELDVDNDMDLFCLQYVFLPRINVALSEFTEAYNHHGLRTEHSMSPCQIWVNGMINVRRHNSTTVNEVVSDESPVHLQTYGIDPNEAVVNNFDTSDAVDLNFTDVHVDNGESILDNLRVHFDPIKESTEYGIDIYLSARAYVQSLLSHSTC